MSNVGVIFMLKNIFLLLVRTKSYPIRANFKP